VLSHAFRRSQPPGAMIHIVAGLDHALATSEMRRLTVAQIVEFLGQDAEFRHAPWPGAAASDRPDTEGGAWHGASYQCPTAEEACPP